MLSCPRHQDVVLTDSRAGLVCYLCAAVVEPVEVGEPGHKVLPFRPKSRETLGPAPKREGTYDRPIDDGQTQRTIDDLREHLAQHRDDRDATLKLADLLDRAGQPAEAARYFHQVGDWYRRDGVALRAVATYKYVLKLDPKRLDALRDLACAYAALGLTPDAQATIRRVWRHHRERGELGAAYESLSALRSVLPDFAPAEPGWLEHWAVHRRVLSLLPAVLAQVGPVRSEVKLNECLRDLEWALRAGTLKRAQVVPWALLYLQGKGEPEALSPASGATGGGRAAALLWAMARERLGHADAAKARYQELLAQMGSSPNAELRAELESRRHGFRPTIAP